MDILKTFQRVHADELRQLHFTMFEYNNLPDTVDPLYIETYLQEHGDDSYIAWWKLNASEASPGFPEGSLIVSSATLGTDLNPYGEGAEVIAVTRNGHERRFKNRYEDDVVVGFNNITHEPCNDIELDAATLAEIDLSILYLIHYTRLYPVFKAADEKTRDKIVQAFKNMEVGKPLTIIDKPLLEELGIETKSLETETLTNPELSSVIQFTSKLREDVKRWHFTKYGQTINSSSKLAQETVDEVNGAVSASLIIPLSMLAARRAMIEEVNRKFGTNIEVNLSGAWRAEVTRYEEISGEDDIDGSEEGEADLQESVENIQESEVQDDEKEEDTDRDTEKSDDN